MGWGGERNCKVMQSWDKRKEPLVERDVTYVCAAFTQLILDANKYAYLLSLDFQF